MSAFLRHALPCSPSHERRRGRRALPLLLQPWTCSGRLVVRWPPFLMDGSLLVCGSTRLPPTQSLHPASTDSMNASCGLPHRCHLLVCLGSGGFQEQPLGSACLQASFPMVGPFTACDPAGLNGTAVPPGALLLVTGVSDDSGACPAGAAAAWAQVGGWPPRNLLGEEVAVCRALLLSPSLSRLLGRLPLARCWRHPYRR